jgi:Rad3-related DNA helicase
MVCKEREQVMIKKLAQGNGWELTHETHKHTLDRTYLRLYSEYGIIEIKTFDATMLHALEKVEQEYNRLKEQGLTEQAILKAAENADDNLQDLIQIAIENMDETQANRLLDKVHQVQKESLQDILAWKGEPTDDDYVPDNPLDEDWIQPDDA